MSKCQETAGFLISAHCREEAVDRCIRCEKPICEAHGRDAVVSKGKHCITCHRKSGAIYQASGDDDPYLLSGSLFAGYYALEEAGWTDGREAFETADNEPVETPETWESDFDAS